MFGAPSAALAGQQSNTATVTVMDETRQRYSDDDLAHYFGRTSTATTGIRIVKAINAVDPNQPTTLEDANDADRPVDLVQGVIPTFTFQVQNLGTRALSGITITDDAATDALGDDYSPVPVLRAQRNVGDTDRDGLLDAGETWLYTSLGVLTQAPPAGNHVNVARVTGTDVVSGTIARDDDVAHYRVSSPVHASGRMTGGGSIFTDDGMRVTHGFELHCDINVGPNNLQVNFEGNRFHLEQLTFVACYDDPALNPLPRQAPFDTMVGEGVGRFNGVDGYRVWFTFTDNGEPGKKDFARIEIRDPQGRLVLFVADNLHNGNQQAHPENKTAALQAASAPVSMVQDAALQEATLAALFVQARREWVDAGVTSEQLARLDSVQLRVADLPGLALGQAEDGLITIDTNAAGWGWFVDATPQDDAEFGFGAEGRVAKAGPAAGRMDLLSVVSHEVGHLLGLHHADHGVMDDRLAAGTRPTASALAPAQSMAGSAPTAPVAKTTGAFDIDWAVHAPRQSADSGTATRSAAKLWQERFVTQLGAASGAGPNAALRLHLDTAPRATAKPGVLSV